MQGNLYVGFVVDKVAKKPAYLPALQFSPTVKLDPLLISVLSEGQAGTPWEPSKKTILFPTPGSSGRRITFTTSRHHTYKGITRV